MLITLLQVKDIPAKEIPAKEIPAGLQPASAAERRLDEELLQCEQALDVVLVATKRSLD